MRQYYNPDSFDRDVALLNWANFATLMASQALLGSVTPNMIAVVMNTSFESSVELVFSVDAFVQEDRDEVDETLSALESYLSHLDFHQNLELGVVVRVEPDFKASPSAVDSRLIYLRHRTSS